MRLKILQSAITLLFLFNVTIFADTVVDDFNRATLGSNWTADPEYKIVNNKELANTSTRADWTSLAVYNAVSNPVEVSFRWSTSGVTEGANSGGLALRLGSASVTANGYHVFRRYATIILSPVVNGIVLREAPIHEVSATLATPQPGDVIKIVISSDESGHHFDYYQNGEFDARVTDANKTYGNEAKWYCGVNLFGNRENNIDDFTVTYPSLTVTSPNGGENWQTNSAKPILWTSDTFTSNVRIEYSLNAGTTWNTIVASTANNGSYSWTTPTTPATQCLIRISDALDGQPQDVSNGYFSLYTPEESVTVLTPNGGEAWVIGTEKTITWFAGGGIANVKIQYSIDNAATWTTITASTPNTGTYNWSIPSTPSTKCLVKISDARDGIPFDQSNGTFSLSALVQLRVNDASGQPGSFGNSVVISMNNLVTVKGVQFTLTDTPDLLIATGVTTTGRAPGFTASFVESGSTVELILISFSGSEIAVGNGPLLEIYYDAIPPAPGTYDDSIVLSLSNVNVADANNNRVFAETIDGIFRFATPGDMDGDGDVDVNDINRLADIMLGNGAPASEHELLTADFDNDGDIDLYDLLEVYDLL